jgi:hypothetical protein
MELLAIGFVGLSFYAAYKESKITPTCSDQDIKKYNDKLDSILSESIDKVKGAKVGYTTRIDDSRFGRTGYHDEDEWKTYRAILYSKNINACRTSYTGIDSSIQLTVL